jgi:hypothetical protein
MNARRAVMSETKEVIYRLVAEYDGEIVFESEYPDTTELQYDLHKAEAAVERALEEDQELEDEQT